MAKQHFLDGEIDLPKLEEKVLKFWDENKIFDKSLEQTADGKPFTFYDGPPFATGLPHYGHLLASTIKDLVPRYQTMNGRFVRRRWGWDCHGLPIEELVERKLGISGKKQIEDVGIKTFNETCRSVVLQYVGEWREMVRRIARWVDFDDSYKTMDASYMESVWWGFKNIYDKGLVYEGRKVLLYCPRCETPLSSFEVAMDNSYKDVAEESVIVKFKLKSENAYLLAWTTTPWTLPGNVALAVGKDISYSFVQTSGGLYGVASDLVSKLFTPEMGSVKKEIKGSDLIGLEYEPLFNVPAMESDTSYKVYAADFVKTDEGTGIVHTAVVYGEDDYALGVANGLPIVPLLDEKGHFNDKAPEAFRGQYFKKAEKAIKEDLEARGLLFKREMHTHSYPHCWRCGTALYYNAIPAWFINIQKIKPQLLASNDKEINWFPEHLKHGRYEKSVEAAPDWNISRNRYWGNPVPTWKCEACEKVEVVGSLEELSEKAGPAKNNYWAIRHGESENVIFNITDSGDQNFHLTEKGIEQVKVAAKILDSKKIDLIFASDLLRTKETAALIAETLGDKKIHFDERLREINLASLSGKPNDEYTKRLPTQRERFECHAVPGAESLRDVRARAWSFLREMEERHHGKNIAIVSHEDTIWMLSEVALGWSEKEAARRKDEHHGRFMEPAAILELGLKKLPRNDTGEADMHRPYIDEITFVCTCGGVMSRTPEIFDSWVEAGSMPFAEHHYPFENKKTFDEHFPAQFVAEYIAQTRAWFYVMHVLSFALFEKAPFENVVTTGTILAEDGSKMSKSKNNFPDPHLLLDKYGADSLRFYLMSSVVMQADNLNFSEKGVESVYRKVGLLLVNVYKYFATYEAEQADAKKDGEASGDHALLDSWITMKTEELAADVTKYLDAYDTVHATRAIQEYIDGLSTWYLRRSRRRKDAAFFETMRTSLLTTSKMIAPFMPFLAEALYSELAGGSEDGVKAESVHLCEWPRVEFSLGEKERKQLAEGMDEVRRLASVALAKRAEAKIKVRQPLAELRIPDGILKDQDELLQILADEVNVKKVTLDPKLKDKDAVELDTAITPELREEGLLRDVSRMVQELRQKAGLQPRDKIVLSMELSTEIRGALMKHEDTMKKDVGATLVEYGRSDKFEAEEETKLDGKEIWIGLRKV